MIKKITTSRDFLFSPSAQEIFTVHILGNPSIEALKAAVINSVQKQEILNSRIAGDADGEYYYIPMRTPVVPSIEVRDYQQDYETFVNEQSRKTFDLANGELIRFIIVPTETCTELHIMQHHLGGDGRSLMAMIDDIMNNLKKIDDQNGDLTLDTPVMQEIQPLTRQDLEEALPISDLMKMSIEKFNENWSREKVLFTQEDYEEMFEEYWSRTYINERRMHIRKPVLSKILKRCKEEGVTLNNVILTLAAKGFRKSTKIGLAVDCRPEKYTSSGNYAGFALIEGCYDESKSFWENASVIQNLSSCSLADKANALMGCRIYDLIDRTLLDATYFQNIDRFKSNLVKEYDATFASGEEGIPFFCSNLGRVNMPAAYGRYAVDAIDVISPLVPCLKSNFAVATVNGNMSICAGYKEGTGIDFETIIDTVEQGLYAIAESGSVLEDEVSFAKERELQFA